MKICPKCGNSSYEKIENITRCLICHYILEKIEISVVKKNNQPVIKKLSQVPIHKGEAHVDKSSPTPDGIVMVDKRGVKYRIQSGRKRTGEWRNCTDCGNLIYVRSYRKGANQGKRCAPCNRKVY